MALPYGIEVKTEQRYWRAFEYLEITARAAAPGATVHRVDDVNLAVDLDRKRLVVTFAHSQLNDLEDGLSNSALPTPYVKGLRADINFYLYQKLAAEEMLFPGFKLSEFLVKIERDWFPECRLVTRFNAETVKGLIDGLRRLEQVLAQNANVEVQVPEIEQELAVLRGLISFYEANRHMNATADAESLSYLKAAAIVWIIGLERQKEAQPSARVKAAYDNKIFSIAAEFQMQPYNRIKLPAGMQDYLVLEKEGSDSRTVVVRQHVELERLLEKTDPRLKERWLGAWQVLGSDNPDAASQAANSTVEILKQVIGRLCGDEKFENYLERRFPEQAAMAEALRKWIRETRDGLERVKHHPTKQDISQAELLMNGAEIIIKLLLR